MLEENLCNGVTYKELTKNEALKPLDDFKEDLYKLLCAKQKRKLEKRRKKYFERGYKQFSRIPQL